jgi:hypothetical protein
MKHFTAFLAFALLAASASGQDTRIKPTTSQSSAVRKLREKMTNMPVPENLTVIWA